MPDDEVETRYARAPDGTHLAYQVVGQGEVDLVFVGSWFSHVDVRWDYPPFARHVRRLASFARVLLFDKRGIGASDPVDLSRLPVLETWNEDVLTVMDAAGMDRAAVWGVADAGPMAMAFAALHPERTAALCLANTTPVPVRRDDYPWGLPADTMPAEVLASEWGTGRGAFVAGVAPSKAHDDEFRSWYARYQRMAASPGVAVAMWRRFLELDVRDVLPAIGVPTLVLHRRGCWVPVGNARYLAERIAGARLVELDGSDMLTYLGDSDALLDEVEEFLTGTRGALPSERQLAAVLFTDIVDSTRRSASVGDRRWRELLDDHDAVAGRALRRFGGRLVNTTGDGLVATFEGPARAVLCAVALRDRLADLGLEIRAGVHVGEVERRGRDIAGLAVHIAARVAAAATGGQVLVTRTVSDLVVGSGLALRDRGDVLLKGVPDPWRLYEVADQRG